MYKFTIILLSFCCIIGTGLAQDAKSDFGIKFSGFVRNDIFYDTRMTVNAREGVIEFYPAERINNMDGKDINDRPNFNILSILSRLSGKITGPDAFGAKTSAVIEGEFFGSSEAAINNFRLRHAYIKFDWENSQLLIGQTWNTFFVPEAVADLVSANPGAPFQPFTRNPQIRFTQKLAKELTIAPAIAMQRDYSSILEGNAASNDGIRYSKIPMLNLEIKYSSPSFVAGAVGNYKMINPNPVTSKKIVNDEYLSSVSFGSFIKVAAGDFVLRTQGFYTQNATDLTMLGGFVSTPLDTLRGINTYTNLQNISAIIDMSYGNEIKVGLFGGYSQNLGATEDCDLTKAKAYGRAVNMKSLFRIAPRLVFTSGKFVVGGEVEYTNALYSEGNKFDVRFIPQNTYQASNIRFLLTTVYNF